MTDDNDTQDEIALAAEYALGLLTPGEAMAFDDLLAVDPEMRDHYAAWATNFASLTDDIAPVDPPAHLQGQIAEKLFGSADKKPSIFARFGFLGPALAGLAAAVLVLVALNQTSLLKDAGPTYVAEIAAEDASLVVKASFDPGTGTLQMTREAGTPLADRSQELWLIAGENAPISLGVWPQGQSEASLEISADLATQFPGGILAISDEPLGGSPTGGPTGAILGAGPLTLL